MRFALLTFMTLSALSVSAAPLSKCQASMNAMSSGAVYIHPGSDPKKCLGAGDSRAGSPIIVQDCPITPDPAFIWMRYGSALQVYDKCLDLTSGNPQNGQKVQLNDCKKRCASQHWSFHSGAFRAAVKDNKGIRKCLDMTDGNPEKDVQSWKCFKKNTNQQWTATPVWH